MRVAVIAHLRHPIAAPFMGGMEAHCHLLVRSLVQRGHDVTLFASGDSDAALPLRTVTPSHYEAVLPWAQWHGTAELTAFQDTAFSTAWAMIANEGFDVVHNNAMHPAIHNWARRDNQPMVTSLHVPPFAGLADAVARTSAPWLRQTLTSNAHRASWWDAAPSTTSVVHNAVDPALWPFVANGNGRAVWYGRITPNKGTGVALDAAHKAGLPLDVIGPIDCMDYYEAEVAPRLDSDRIYLGTMAGRALADRVGAASVLLATPMWDEPFGLVAVEAMACGVPVAALDRGAMREVIGDCGAVVSRPEHLPDAIGTALYRSRPECRARAERLFSIDRMMNGYEAAYAAALASNRSSTDAVLA